MSIQISFGGYQGDRSVHTRGARILAEAVEHLTDGAAQIDFRQNIVEDGHKAADLLTMTETGALDGCYFSSSYLTDKVPELALFDQHFAVPSRAHAYAILDGSLGARLKRGIEAKTDYAVLGYWDNGLRHITATTQAMRQPSDCQGLKLRTLKSDDHQRVFRALGFDPIAIDVRDLPDAVTTGRVDAQENPLTNAYNFNLHKTHRTITLTGHLLGVALVLFNRNTVESWPADIQHAVRQAVVEATEAQRGFAQEDDIVCAKALADDGVTLVELSAEERAGFERAVQSEVEATRARFDADLIAMFENDLAQVDAGTA